MKTPLGVGKTVGEKPTTTYSQWMKSIIVESRKMYRLEIARKVLQGK